MLYQILAEIDTADSAGISLGRGNKYPHEEMQTKNETVVPANFEDVARLLQFRNDPSDESWIGGTN